jgi:hypothetical protein
MGSSRLQPGTPASDLPMAIHIYPMSPKGLARKTRQVIGLPIGREGEEKLSLSQVFVADIGGLGNFPSPYLCAQAVTRSTITKGFLLSSRGQERHAKEEA